jgi:predicted outer membrane repeat protein
VDEDVLQLFRVDTIELGNGLTYDLTLTSGIGDQAQDDLDVISRIIINGHGSTIRRNSATAFRIFDVGDATDGTGNGNLTLNDVIVTNGDAGTGSGGGIRVNQASIVIVNTNSETLDGVTVQGNTAANGGGIYIDQGSFLLLNDTANNLLQNVTVDGSLVVNNTATVDGGGIYVAQTGTLVIGNEQTLTVMNGSLVAGNLAASNAAVSTSRRRLAQYPKPQRPAAGSAARRRRRRRRLRSRAAAQSDQPERCGTVADHRQQASVTVATRGSARRHAELHRRW